MNTRPTWDVYFQNITDAVAVRADCRRRKVGAVIVKDHRIVATGYNGGPAGGASCLAGECPRGLLTYEQIAALSNYDDGAGKCISVHAEQNALLYSSRADVVGGTIYITCEPCEWCRRLIAGSGIVRVVWPEGEYNLGDVHAVRAESAA